ncbi:MAG: XTP/dITP diphosphatase [Lentisphaerae bacterium]|nr:XTP/dITP diphosphatase [Lentisphaerota bacterium]
MKGKLLVATTNPHKIVEIREILRVPGIQLVTPADVGGVPEVVEDGRTFESNAVKKAVIIARAARTWALADDSGLEVDALGGEPGVRSARYAGEPSDHAANIRKLLAAMGGIADRRARFRCAIALASPDGRCRLVEGACEGNIADAPRGSGGFGYDPVFIPNGYDKTFAELGAEDKNAISHRALALLKAAEDWRELFLKLRQ